MLIPIDSLSLPSCPSCPSSFSLTTLCHRVSPPFLLGPEPSARYSLPDFPFLGLYTPRRTAIILLASPIPIMHSFPFPFFFLTSSSSRADFSLRVKRKLAIQIIVTDNCGLKLRSKFSGFKFFSRNFWFLYSYKKIVFAGETEGGIWKRFLRSIPRASSAKSAGGIVRNNTLSLPFLLRKVHRSPRCFFASIHTDMLSTTMRLLRRPHMLAAAQYRVIVLPFTIQRSRELSVEKRD